MKKSKQKTTMTIVVMLAIVIAVSIGFWQVMEGKRTEEQEQQLLKSNNEEVNALLKKDFESNYPSTAREVLKVYSRINVCIYNQDLSKKEITALTEKMRKLFDEELLAVNPLDEQLEDLNTEIKEYKDTKKSISNYVIDKDSTIAEKEMDGKEYANVNVSYLIKEGDGYAKTYEQFLLRKDTQGRWKIVGWQLIEDTSNENENSEEIEQE